MSSRTITTCDRCGAEIDCYVDIHKLTRNSYTRSEEANYKHTDYYDLCQSCAKDFDTFLHEHKR